MSTFDPKKYSEFLSTKKFSWFEVPDVVLSQVQERLLDPDFGVELTLASGEDVFLMPKITKVAYEPEEKRTYYSPGYPAEIEFEYDLVKQGVDEEPDVVIPSDSQLRRMFEGEFYNQYSKKLEDVVFDYVEYFLQEYGKESYGSVLTNSTTRSIKLSADMKVPDFIEQKVNSKLKDSTNITKLSIDPETVIKVVPQVKNLRYLSGTSLFHPAYMSEINYDCYLLDVNSSNQSLIECEGPLYTLFEEEFGKQHNDDFYSYLHEIVDIEMRDYLEDQKKQRTNEESTKDVGEAIQSILRATHKSSTRPCLVEKAYYVPLYRILSSKQLPESMRLKKAAYWMEKNEKNLDYNTIVQTFRRAEREDLLDFFIQREDVELGDKVRSKLTNRIGEVVKMHWDGETVDVKWEAGGIQPISKGSLLKMHSEKDTKFDHSDISQVESQFDNYGSILGERRKNQ